MLSTVLITALSAFALVNADGAPVVSGNPSGVTYTASFTGKGGVTGTISGQAAPDGNGVAFSISFQSLPDPSLGPFPYHIHVDKVPADGNCTGTGAHLDPYNRGETPLCDASMPQTCQVGDLAGKHGKMDKSGYTSSYTDPYVSTKPGDNAFFGDRSAVVHFGNKTRLACADFVASYSTPNASSSVAPSGTGYISQPTSPMFQGAGAKTAVSLFGVLGGVLAALAM